MDILILSRTICLLLFFFGAQTLNLDPSCNQNTETLDPPMVLNVKNLDPTNFKI